jgi:class 3 adenylate cyclase
MTTALVRRLSAENNNNNNSNTNRMIESFPNNRVIPTANSDKDAPDDVDLLEEGKLRDVLMSLKHRNIIYRVLCSLRTYICVLVLVMVIGLVVVTTILSAFGASSTMRLTEHLEIQMIDGMDRFIDALVTSAKVMNHQALSAFKSELFSNSSGDFYKAKDYMWHTFSSCWDNNPDMGITLAITMLNSAQLNLIGISGTKNMRYMQVYYMWEGITPPNTVELFFGMDNIANVNYSAPLILPTAPMPSMHDYALTLRNTSYWKPPYGFQCVVYQDGKEVCQILLEYIAPKLDGHGVVEAYSTYTLTAVTLSYQLKSYANNIDGADAFIIDISTGNIVGCSDMDTPIIVKSTLAMIQAKDFGNPLISRTAIALAEEYGDKYSSLHGRGRFKYYHKELSALVDVTVSKYNGGSGLDWVLVLCVKEMELVGESIGGISGAIVGSVIIIAVALVIGLLYTILIVQPLKSFVVQLEYLETMQLDLVTDYPLSKFSEIAKMQGTFYHVVSRLREYKSFLPSHLLARDFGEEDDNHNDDKSLGIANSGKSSFSLSKASDSETGSKMSGSSRRSSDKKRQMLALGLQFSKGCVATIRITNMKELFTQFTPMEIVVQHGALLAEVERAVKRTRGINASFNDHKFTIVWLDSSSNYVQLACHCCLMIQEGLKNMNHSGKENMLNVEIAIASGELVFGNMGTKHKRQFTIFGPVDTLSKTMVSINREWEVSTLVNEDLMKKTSHLFTYRPIAQIYSSGNHTTTSSSEKQESTRVYQLIGRKIVKQDEWMYELSAKEKQDYDQYIQGYELFMEGKYQESKEAFAEHLKMNEDDFATLKMIQLCQFALEDSSSCATSPADRLTYSIQHKVQLK